MLKRIAIVAPEFKSEYILHQPWRQVYEIAKRLRARGIDVAIVTSGTSEDEIGGVKIISLAQQYIRRLDRESKSRIASFSPEVIYWIGNSFSGLYMKHNRLDVPLVLHISSVHMMPRDLANLTLKEIVREHRLQLVSAFYPFNRMIASNLNHQNISGIICASRAISDRLAELGVGRAKMKTSPVFFEPDIVQMPAGDNSNTSSAVICYAGPLDTIRGSNIILESVQILKKRGIDVKLLFLLRSRNPDAEKALIENTARKMGIADSIEIVAGILPRSKVYEYMLSSRIVAIPTKFVWNEPPLTVLEAMYLGRPVVTTNVCGLPELVAGHTMTVKPSACDFADAIEEMISNKGKSDVMAAKARSYVKSLPGWDALTDWTIKTLEEFRDGKQ